MFPALPGLLWNSTRTPEFHTKVQKAVSGRELRAAMMAYPMYRFKLEYEFLRDDRSSMSPASPRDELKKLGGFFTARMGMFDSFLYTDPADNAVTDQLIGTGDGATKTFQLTRTYGAGGFTFIEPVQNVNLLTNLKVNGVAKANPADYSVSATGLITFVTAPGAALSVTWTGTYYYRVRFNIDMADFNQFMYDLWEFKKCELYGAPGNKV